jgi:cytochrome oxidase assembly protein ShyY1
MLARLRHFRFDWKLTLLTAVLLPLLLSLGFWQLRREQEKLDLQQQYAARQSELPVALEQLDPADDHQYRQVEFSGHYDNGNSFLLDNRVHEGQVGYDLITPVITEANLVVMVNRGWLPQGPSRAQLPVPEAITGNVTLRGSVYVPVGTPFVLDDAIASGGGPRVIQLLNPAQMAEAAGYSASMLFPYSVRLAEGAPGVLVRDWPVISTTPEKHRGYAVQWFAMAAMLLGLYLYYSTRPETPVAN